MVAITVTEVARLKALVQADDPNALVIVTSAQEILGRGFKPFVHAAGRFSCLAQTQAARHPSGR